MDATIIISTISAIASIAAAVIYYYTLNELKKQCANTYRPHLFIDNTHFRISRSDFNNATVKPYHF